MLVTDYDSVVRGGSELERVYRGDTIVWEPGSWWLVHSYAIDTSAEYVLSSIENKPLGGQETGTVTGSKNNDYLDCVSGLTVPPPYEERQLTYSEYENFPAIAKWKFVEVNGLYYLQNVATEEYLTVYNSGQPLISNMWTGALANAYPVHFDTDGNGYLKMARSGIDWKVTYDLYSDAQFNYIQYYGVIASPNCPDPLTYWKLYKFERRRTYNYE